MPFDGRTRVGHIWLLRETCFGKYIWIKLIDVCWSFRRVNPPKVRSSSSNPFLFQRRVLGLETVRIISMGLNLRCTDLALLPPFHHDVLWAANPQCYGDSSHRRLRPTVITTTLTTTTTTDSDPEQNNIVLTVCRRLVVIVLVCLIIFSKWIGSSNICRNGSRSLTKIMAACQ